MPLSPGCGPQLKDTSHPGSKPPRNGNYAAGPSPLSYAFYTFGFDPQGLEWRHWFQQDTGYAVTSYASRPSGKDGRSYSLWDQGRVLCDQSTGRGYCPPGG